MPCPVLTYQPSCVTSRFSAAFHSLSSSALVPDWSARDTQVDPPAAMACSAATAGFPAMCAGSAGAPRITKSLCMTRRRSMPAPVAMKATSASGEWTSKTSALPSLPIFSAAPEPTATGLTW